MLTEKAILKTETVFSEDRRHRYLLRKEWDTKKPKATIIMTNPSSANLMTMDYTQRPFPSIIIETWRGTLFFCSINLFLVISDILAPEQFTRQGFYEVGLRETDSF